MNGYPLDHVAIAVRSIQESAATFEPVTGCACSTPEELPSQGVNVAFMGTLELIEPRSSDGAVARFLEGRGSGLHHIAYRVPDIRAALQELKTRGFQLIDQEPRLGARGHQVAFLDPKTTDGVLIELVQEST
jgi:methylmalonyl-CoA/ethylmalonyl-CoA epimerase